MSNFSPKMAGETQYLSFDFSEFLQPDEKLVFASVEAKVAKSKDPEYKKFVYGNCLIEGAVVSQRVTGGKADVTYKLIATVETSNKQVLKLAGSILVKADVEIELDDDADSEDVVIDVKSDDVPEVVDTPAEEALEITVEPSVDIEPEELKSTEMDVKKFEFNITETKEIKRDGITYGIIEGYASTYGNVDRVNDIVSPGAFAKTIKRHIEDKRPVRMYYQHDSKEIIGGFPAGLMTEDSNGLHVVGEVNLEVQRGREVYALAKQRVLTDFSIGYTVKDYKIKDGIRDLKELELWEISVVAEPANPKAKIIQVKSTEVPDGYPIADKDTVWDVAEALKRIREFSGSTESPSESFKNFFMCVNEDAIEEYASYTLPYVDIIDGKACVIPRAIFEIAESLSIEGKELDVSLSQRRQIIARVNNYYSKMNLESPIKAVTSVSDLKASLKSKREAEKCLREAGFSRSAAAYFASLIDETKLIMDPMETDNHDQRDAVTETKELTGLLVNLKSLVEKL